MTLAAIRARAPDGLNDAQRRAVEHGLDAPLASPPLLVIAGAGSGKTNALAHRVARLIEAGIDPTRIMLATFSRRAAAEMGRRVERLLERDHHGGPRPRAPDYSGTFHALGARLLREYAERIGLDPQFTILDRADSADLMNWARNKAKLPTGEKRFPTKDTCLAIYSRCVNAEIPLEDALSRHFPWASAHEETLKKLFSDYVALKQRQNVLDYDDLLLYFAQMLQIDEIGAEIAARFDHLLVDEYQDTNRLQADIALRLRPDGIGLTVVGDDAQSIYSFRAATVRNILDFPQNFSPPAKIVALEQNFRSGAALLAASNAMIAGAKERHAKELWSARESGGKPVLALVSDEAEQAAYVAEQVLFNRERGATLRAQAVLFRTSSHSAALELELARRKIPFVKFGGLKFLDAAHVKDVVSILRWAENPKDRIAGFRVAQLLPGVGPARAGAIVDVAGSSGFGALDGLLDKAKDAEGFARFANMMTRLHAGALGWPAELGEAAAWRRESLEQIYDDHAARGADLEALERLSSNFASRERFLSEITLDPPGATSDEAGPPHRDEDYLNLSTIHSAKGLEWRSVFVLNCVDGCIPSDLATGTSEEIEEERRLLYVAMTRAKDDLTLVVPQRFHVRGQVKRGDRHVFAQRTRFLPREILAHFEHVTWPPPRPLGALAKAPRAPAADLAGRMRGMWK